jgi:hypothetical protein
MPSRGSQGERAFLYSLVKLNPLAIWSRERTNSEGCEFEHGLQTGCLDCVMRDFAESLQESAWNTPRPFSCKPLPTTFYLALVFYSHTPITSAVEITSPGTSNSIPEYIIYRTIVQTQTRAITVVTLQSMNWGRWCSGVRISLLQATLVQQPI